MDDHTKELIIDARITDDHKRGQDEPPYRYNPYFGTPLSIILDTSITAKKLVTPHQDRLRDDRNRQLHNLSPI